MIRNTGKYLAAATVAGALAIGVGPLAQASAAESPATDDVIVVAQDDDADDRYDDDWDDQDDDDDDDRDDRGVAAATSEDDWDDDDDDDRDDRGVAAQTGNNTGVVVGGVAGLAALAGAIGLFARRFFTA